MLTTAALSASIAHLYAGRQALRVQLNEADSQLGDGDTGMTVERIIEHLEQVRIPEGADLGHAFEHYGRASARATGSTLGTVVTVALNEAAQAVRGKREAAGVDVAAMFAAAISAVSDIAGSNVGDKTVLDSFDYVRRRLETESDSTGLSEIAIAAARDALEDFRGRRCNMGRARMYAAKSVGMDDPGMLAAYLVLRLAAGREPGLDKE